MIGFIFLSLLLLIVVIWLISPALLGKRKINQDDTDLQNTAIAKERLAELKKQLAQNEISQQKFDQTQTEIEKSLLQDLHDGEDIKQFAPKIERNAYVLITAIPLLAFALYWLWGAPDSINLQPSGMAQHAANNNAQDKAKQRPGSVEDMVAMLAQKLEKDPTNAEGWYTLARSYMSLQQFDKAVATLRTLRKLVGDDSTVLLTLADALTMLDKGKVQGEAFELIQIVLKKKPDDPTALWLAGLGYEQEGNAKQAVKLWKQLLPLLKSEPRSVQQVKLMIASAEKKMGLQPTVGIEPTRTPSDGNNTVAASLRVSVSLSDKVRASAAENDYVLVYARASSGPKMPLAIVRKQVKDLPLTVTLDDSMAMQPTMKLSMFSEVSIIARVSKTGQAIAKSGDIIGQLDAVSVSKSGPLTLTINKVLP